jgi:molecular chaperone DnaK
MGIPSAPRGVPQIEVSFDIDANGIVNVSAKDMGTGKEQSIKITASSGLTEEEIKRLVKDAEMHSEEDRKKRELAEARNKADSLIYATEKTIKEMGDKIDEPTRSEINQSIERLKKAMEGDSVDEINRLSDELIKASHKIAEDMYSRAGQQQQAHAKATGTYDRTGSSHDEDVVDADFHEV